MSPEERERKRRWMMEYNRRRKASSAKTACRAWVPLKERNCKNCMHLHRDMKSGSPCSDCPGIDDEIPSNWEPRKEEE